MFHFLAALLNGDVQWGFYTITITVQVREVEKAIGRP